MLYTINHLIGFYIKYASIFYVQIISVFYRIKSTDPPAYTPCWEKFILETKKRRGRGASQVQPSWHESI